MVNRKHKIVLPDNVQARKSNGKWYYTHQMRRNTPQAGPRTQIYFTPEQPEFWALCAKLNEQVCANDGTINGLIAAYQSSVKYNSHKPNTKRDYDFYLRGIGGAFGKMDVAALTSVDVQSMYDALAAEGTLTKARKSIAVMRALFAFAMPRGLSTHNPANADFDMVKFKSKGSPPWPKWAFDVVDRFARWEVRTFVALGRYTGQRTSDIIKMGPQDVAGTTIRVVQEKTGKELAIPIHRDLLPVLVECRQRGSATFIHSPNGDPMTPDTFRALFDRERAGKKHIHTVNPLAGFHAAKITPHGLRKSAVVKLLEAGVSEENTGLLVGMSRQMVAHYGQGWDQQTRAAEAMAKWEKNG